MLVYLARGYLGMAFPVWLTSLRGGWKVLILEPGRLCVGRLVWFVPGGTLGVLTDVGGLHADAPARAFGEGRRGGCYGGGSFGVEDPVSCGRS